MDSAPIFTPLAYDELPEIGVRVSTRSVGSKWSTAVTPLNGPIVVDFRLWLSRESAQAGHLALMQKWKNYGPGVAEGLIRWHALNPLIHRHIRESAKVQS